MSEKQNDSNTQISFFKQEVKEFVEERNWKSYHTPKNLIQALQIEVAELSELFLFKNYSLEEIFKQNNLLNNISEEIADVFIYLVSLVNVLQLDITEIFLNKMEKNKEKYKTTEFNSGIYYKK